MKPGTRANHSGSSPLTRGKPTPPGAFLCLCRLIPAHAGKTRDSSLGMRRCRAHPRSRGENRPPRGGQKTRRGSSPLTRGKPPPCRFAFDRGRLIPAHAGKTRAPFWHSACQAAHPRSRGENTTRPRPRRKGWGSSPLTRGKLSFLWCVVSDERLIPAHAGKTAKNALKRSLTPGSSPLTRGKRSSTTLSLACQRLIPAHAGKTRKGL